MKELQKALKQSQIIYVTRDLERAIGLPKAYQNYHIISNQTPFGADWSKGKKNVLLIKEKTLLDTRDLLTHTKTKKYLSKIKNHRIVVFKNTSQIEKICAENKWLLLNPPAELANKIEEKISQVEWLGPLTKYLPPHQVMVLKNVTWPVVIPSEATADEESRFIVQFNRAHTGSGTILIESEKQLNELKQKFPNREVRITKFITGPAFTNNNVVWGQNVFIGNINYQITGLAPFTNRPFATIGNDWALPYKILSDKAIRRYKKMATDVGKKLAKDGWKGLFGIDVILDEKTGKLYLIEINARQPASTTYESQLQQAVILSKAKSPSSPNKRDPSAKPQDDKPLTTFEAHLAALLILPATSYQLQDITDGAQIILKNKEKKVENKELNIKIKKLKDLQLNVVPYQSNEPESDLLRIQSPKNIMELHAVFNRRGAQIEQILRPHYFN